MVVVVEELGGGRAETVGAGLLTARRGPLACGDCREPDDMCGAAVRSDQNDVCVIRCGTDVISRNFGILKFPAIFIASREKNRPIIYSTKHGFAVPQAIFDGLWPGNSGNNDRPRRKNAMQASSPAGEKNSSTRQFIFLQSKYDATLRHFSSRFSTLVIRRFRHLRNAFCEEKTQIRIFKNMKILVRAARIPCEQP